MSYIDQQQDQQQLRKHFNLAREAVAYVKGKMDIGASNKLQPWEFYGKIAKAACAGSPVNKGELATRVGEELAQMGASTWQEQLDVEARWARDLGCGNCGPQSAMAFVFLRDKGVRPLDWMHYNRLQHAFVIIGRDEESVVEDARSWGKTAVICDPWRERAEPAMPYGQIWFVNKTLALLHRER